MKKEDIASWFVYGLMIVIALFVGLQIIAPAFQVLSIVGAAQYAYAIITILIGFLLNAFLLELGHVLGAVVGQYDIRSVNVLGLAIYRSGAGWRLGLKNYEGLTGETIVAPKNDKAKPTLNLWGGLVIYFIEVVVGFSLAYSLFPVDQWGRYALIIIIAIGGMLMIYNFMPFKMDTITDGYRLATMNQGRGNAMYQELTRIEKALKEKKNPFPAKVFKEQNTFTLQITFYQLYQFLFDEAYEDAMKLTKKTMTIPRIADAMLAKLKTIELYIQLITNTGKNQSRYFYDLDSRERKYIANDNQMTTISTYLMVAGLIEDSYSEAFFCFERVSGALKRIHEPGRKQAEEVLFNRVFKRVKQKHKDWKF
jgi:hypothetical protein